MSSFSLLDLILECQNNNKMTLVRNYGIVMTLNLVPYVPTNVLVLLWFIWITFLGTTDFTVTIEYFVHYLYPEDPKGL